MTNEQEQLAEQLIAAIKQNNGSINWKGYTPIMQIDGMERLLVIRGLRDKGIIEDVGSGTSIVRLTETGWEFKGFEAERQKQSKEETIKEQIDHLTIHQLKGNIFQLKYWWLFLLINLVISLIVAWLTKGWK
jgi:hypothetical protein